jgi:hypothetical protein
MIITSINICDILLKFLEASNSYRNASAYLFIYLLILKDFCPN